MTFMAAMAMCETVTTAQDQRTQYVSHKVEAPFEMEEIKEYIFPNKTFNIARYGAKMGVEEANVKTNTNAIGKAIKACNKAGGGTVLVPKGEWLTGDLPFLFLKKCGGKYEIQKKCNLCRD